MNTKSVAFLLLAIFASLSSFEFSEINSVISNISSSSVDSLDSLSSSNFVSCVSGSSGNRLYNLVEDIKELRKRSRSDVDNEFWDAIESENYKLARRLKKKHGFNLDQSDVETCDSLSDLLESDETPLKTLEFLYAEHPQVFYFSQYDCIDESPFYKATQRNIAYLTIEHSDDRTLMRDIKKVTDERERELINGTSSDYI